MILMDSWYNLIYKIALFFVGKMWFAKDSHIFSTKKITLYLKMQSAYT